MLRTYSKRKGNAEVCPKKDKFDSVVSRDNTRSGTGDTSNEPQALQEKPPDKTSDTGTSEYTLTMIKENVSPIEAPRRRESIEVPELLSPILPQVQEKAADKVNRWLQHSADQSPSSEEKCIGPRHRRMNSTLMDNSQAQNAEDAMKHLQGISTICEGEDILLDDSPLWLPKSELKRLKQTLETTPPVRKSTANPKAPTKTGSQQRKRKGILLPKNPAKVFGLEPEDQIPIPTKSAKRTKQARVARQPPGKLKVQTESLNKLEPIDEMEGSAGQLSSQWISLHHPKKSAAKTSTPAKRGPATCEDMHMFSVDLSSVNPSNETGVELQTHQSRFVNSSEVVHDSDYLTPEPMRNKADAPQNGQTQHSSKLLAPHKKPNDRKSTSTDRKESILQETKGSKKRNATKPISAKQEQEKGNSSSKGPVRSSARINAAKKTVAKTSTPAKRGQTASGDQHMFSIDLSSVNPSNETGVELQTHQSRFVNSSEIVHDSDYLTPEPMKNQTAATQKSQSRSVKAMVSTQTSIEDNKCDPIEDEPENKNAHNSSKLLAPAQKDAEGKSTGKNIEFIPETNGSNKTAPKGSTKPKRKKELSKVSQHNSRRINAASAKGRLAVGKAVNTAKCYRMGQFPRVRLNNPSQTSKSSRNLRNAKEEPSQRECTNNELSQELIATEKGESETAQDQENRELSQKSLSSTPSQGSIKSIIDAEAEGGEVSSPEIQRHRNISIDSIIETVGVDASTPNDDISTRRSSGRKSVTFADSFQIKPICEISIVPVCCLSLFDENRPKKKERSRPMKVDYKTLCANVSIDCLTLFDE